MKKSKCSKGPFVVESFVNVGLFDYDRTQKLRTFKKTFINQPNFIASRLQTIRPTQNTQDHHHFKLELAQWIWHYLIIVINYPRFFLAKLGHHPILRCIMHNKLSCLFNLWCSHELEQHFTKPHPNDLQPHLFYTNWLY
jgi:hypothetical protein